MKERPYSDHVNIEIIIETVNAFLISLVCRVCLLISQISFIHRLVLSIYFSERSFPTFVAILEAQPGTWNVLFDDKKNRVDHSPVIGMLIASIVIPIA